MADVNWSGILKDHFKDMAVGEIDPSEIINEFERSLNEYIKNRAKEQKLKDQNVRHMAEFAHEIFDEHGADKMMKEEFIFAMLIKLKSKPSDMVGQRALVLNFLESGDRTKHEDFGTILGPGGGLIRAKDRQSNSTRTGIKEHGKVKFGAVKRATKTKPDAPQAAPERFVEADEPEADEEPEAVLELKPEPIRGSGTRAKR